MWHGHSIWRCRGKPTIKKRENPEEFMGGFNNSVGHMNV
jgi:hypothetical protein